MTRSGGGLPGTAIVGLPQSAVKESKDRVKAAIRHAGFAFPKVKVIVNLAPADLPKRGGRFDLPIALGILIASGELAEGCADGLIVVGELGLGGELRVVEGTLSAAQAYRDGGEGLLLPSANVAEARRCRDVRVRGVATLREACAALAERDGPRLFTANEASPGEASGAKADAIEIEHDVLPARGGDLADVVGLHAGAPCARDRRGGGAQPALLRAAGHGQVDALEPAAGDPAADDGARGDGDGGGGVGQPRALRPGGVGRVPVSLAAPHGVGHRARRRGLWVCRFNATRANIMRA